jgi:hypothetical protein
MTPDAKRRQATAAACKWDSYRAIWRDIREHTIPNMPDHVVVACSRCGTPTTRAGLCHTCANPEGVR